MVMKYWPLILLLFFINATAYGNETTRIIHNAELKFKSGELFEGKALLQTLSNTDTLSYPEQAIIYNKIAWFYEELVGNYQSAQRHSRHVLKYPLPASHDAIIEAKKRIERLDQYASQFRKENLIIRNMQIEATDRSDAINKINELKQLIQNSHEYPNMSIVYHHIGKHYLFLENYYKSYKIFSNLLESHPGIIFLLPTQSLMDKAKSKWHYVLVDTISKSAIIIVLILLSILLVLSKFWEWMNLKMLILLPISILIWALFLIGSSWILNFFIPDQKYQYLPVPYFIQSTPFSPGSEILLTIFLYGILGIICSFLLSLSMRRFNWPNVGIIINCSILTLFMSALFASFYLNHCYTSGVFEKRANSIFPAISGHTLLLENDFEPLILSNPRKYPNLTLSNTSDKIFIDWMNKQYSIISR
ncbi:MAG: MFS transporter [Desulfobacteraceae bacterium]|nr:MFS transporter [Desulfobacteraceae bacterium]